MLKVLHVVERLDDRYGGPSRSVPLLCKGLSELGVINVIASVNYERDENELIKEFGLKWEKYKPSFLPGLYFSIEMIMKIKLQVREADVIHFHSLWTFPTYIAFRYARKLGRKIVLSPRSSLFHASLKKSQLKKLVARYLFVNSFLSKLDLAVASSEPEKEQLPPVKRAVVIPNCVYTDEFDSGPDRVEARKILNLPVSSKVIGFLSRIHSRKGLHHLVDAWVAECDRSDDDIILLVAGPIDDQLYFDEIINVVAKTNHQEKFRYLGMLQGYKRIAAFKSLDLFVLPSEFENFGMSIAEALVAGVPVITTPDVPWLQIEEWGCGWIQKSTELNINFALGEDLVNLPQKSKQIIERNYGSAAISASVLSNYRKLF